MVRRTQCKKLIDETILLWIFQLLPHPRYEPYAALVSQIHNFILASEMQLKL